MRASLNTLIALASLAPALAHAAPAKQAKPKVSIEEVAVMLASSEEEDLRTALESAPLLPPSEVVPMVEERVRAGLSPTLLDVAIDSLLLLNDRAAMPLLLELTHHRRTEVRVRSLEALARVKTPEAKAALAQALADQAAEVRTAAANALGDSGDTSQFALLKHAFERDVDGAGAGMAKLAKPSDLDGLLGALDQYSLARWQPFYAALLARRDLPEPDKLRAVERLAARGGDDTAEALAALQRGLPADAPARLKKALADAVHRGQNQ